MNTNWTIESLECLSQAGDHTDVVYNIGWRVFAVEGETTTSVYGSETVELNLEGEFIPFEQLTEETVMGWLYTSLGESRKAEIEASATSQLENILAPKIVNKGLPWA